jgi:hypothetical protein
VRLRMALQAACRLPQRLAGLAIARSQGCGGER